MNSIILIFAVAINIFLVVQSQQPSEPECISCHGRNALEANKQIVLGLYQEMFGDKNFEAADKYISSEKYIQHNPNIPDGRESLKVVIRKWLQGRPKEKWDVRRISAEGDLVWAHCKINLAGKDQAVVDIFRIENGKIVEHWDVIQPIPEKSVNDHPMF